MASNIENRSSLNEQTQNKNTSDVSYFKLRKIHVCTIKISVLLNCVLQIFLDIICQQWHYSHSPISSSGCGLRSMKSEKTKGPKLHSQNRLRSKGREHQLNYSASNTYINVSKPNKNIWSTQFRRTEIFIVHTCSLGPLVFSLFMLLSPQPEDEIGEWL
jgi:hypothetical protein